MVRRVLLPVKKLKDHYFLLEKLGEGGFALVHKARDISTG
jgi:serine/threonine protein kinase